MGEVLVDDDALDEHAVLHAASDLGLNLKGKKCSGAWKCNIPPFREITTELTDQRT